MCAYSTVWTRLFGRTSRTRREQSIRPKISRIDFDLTELESSEVSWGPSEQVVGIHTGDYLLCNNITGTGAVVAQADAPMCCLAQWAWIAEVQGSVFSVAGAEMQSARDGTRIWNPSCKDLLDLGLPFGVTLAGTVGDIVGHAPCGGSCPANAPLCDHATGACVEATCAALERYCDDGGPAGVSTRQLCPLTCGCDDPRSRLFSAHPREGCGDACTRMGSYRDALDALPCEDVERDDPDFLAFLAAWETAAESWNTDLREFSIYTYIPAFREYGCDYLAWNPADDDSWRTNTHSYASRYFTIPYSYGTNLCVEGGTWFPIQPLSYFCPVACACASGDPHCPTQCPPKQATDADCPDYQRVSDLDALYDIAFGEEGICPVEADPGAFQAL